MTILDPNTKKPVTSERKVVLAITVVDQRPGNPDPTPHQLAYELDDDDDRSDVQRLLSNMVRSAMQKLDELEVFEDKEDESLIVDSKGNAPRQIQPDDQPNP